MPTTSTSPATVRGGTALTDLQRESAQWIYSMFFFGEDSVTDNLSPFIDAAPKEEQKYFLATQQVDEARHAVFFHRFFKEVIEAGDDIGSTLAFTETQLGWGYRNVFERLDRMADELRRDRSLPKFAQAIALYHLVVEATLAQPGQHFIEDYFAKSQTMPGFSAGMANVSRDEQRHIGFGVKVLSELLAESDECKAAVREILLEIMPYSLAVFVPPSGLNREYTRAYGFEMEDIFAFGLKSVRTKWKAIGYPMEEMPGVLPVDPDLSEHEIAARQIRLLEAGVMGEPNGHPQSDPEIQEIYFSVVANSADTSVVNGNPLTVQWDFTDADPWHVVVANGSTRAEPGRADRRRRDAPGELGRLDQHLEGRDQAQPSDAEPPPADEGPPPRPLRLHEGVPASVSARARTTSAPSTRSRRAQPAAVGVVVVEVYSNSSSAPKRRSSTALRRSSLRAMASTAPMIVSSTRLRKVWLSRLPRSWSDASRSDSAAALQLLVDLLVVHQPLRGVAVVDAAYAFFAEE